MITRGRRRRGLEFYFVAGALLSGVLNIGLVFYIMQHRLLGTGSPITDLQHDGPTIIFKKQNYDQDFFIEVYRNNDIVSNAIQGYDGWESQEISTLNNIFHDYSKDHGIPLSDLTFIDIGANIGWYTLNMAALGVNVIAFEPMGDNNKILKHSLNLPHNIESGISGRVTLYEHGLGVNDEECFLYSDNGNIGDGHVACVESESEINIDENYSVRERVRLKRLDDVLNTKYMKIVAVKIDTEGYEGSVLEGGKKVLLESGIDLFLVQFNPQAIKEKGGDPVEFMNKMAKSGFSVKANSWGADYWNVTDMLDMDKFGQTIATLNSAHLRNKTEVESRKFVDNGNWARDDLNPYYGGNGNLTNYDYDSAYYENNSTNPTLKQQNDGNRFAIEVYHNNDIVSSSIRNSDWEYATVQALNSHFKEYSKKHDIPLYDLTFIDIGANIGWLTMNMAALGVNVIAFEPMEENLKLLKNTLSKKMNIDNNISGRVTLFEHGLGMKDETCILYSENTNFGDGHVKCGNESDLKIPENYMQRGLAPLKRLDDVINEDYEKSMHIVAVNMDTEGFEGNILEGGTRVLLGGSVEIIITEFVPDWVIDKGGDPVQFMKKMADADYHIKDSNWGYKKKEFMLNMTNFGSGEVTFHSPKLFKELVGLSN